MSIDSAFYWALPGPRAFVSKIASHFLGNRILAVNLPNVLVPGLWEAIETGVRNAHIHNVYRIFVREGTDIAADIGMQYHQTRLTGGHLAEYSGPDRSAVILRAEDAKGTDLCAEYAARFAEAIDHAMGNVHLITSLHSEDFESDIGGNGVQVLVFDGGVTPDEMEAYTAVHMLSRSGPGSTRLLRAIVTEFAGFDVEFAERLMLLDDAELLSIRNHLGKLLDEQHDRWRFNSWINRAKSHQSSLPHVLHDQYLLERSTPEISAMAEKRIAKRYWRACVKVLTPWLEERKSQVLGNLSHQINAQRTADGRISVPRSSSHILVQPDELEYNNIVGMYFSATLVPQDDIEKRSVKVCQCAKPVRDDIAHLRPPDPSKIATLVSEMDALIALSS